MKIILMRHGKPILSPQNWIAPCEMEQWIQHYNLSEVKAEGVPLTSFSLANSANFIVASNVRRALLSVQVLGCKVSDSDAVYAEAGLPFALWNFPRLPPAVWAAFFRLLWLIGYSRGSESVLGAKIRAKVAAKKLTSLADKGTVLLVGHGIMNHLIAKELITLGWAAPSKHESTYWGASVYTRQT